MDDAGLTVCNTKAKSEGTTAPVTGYPSSAANAQTKTATLRLGH
jgi:hypothetical protein